MAATAATTAAGAARAGATSSSTAATAPSAPPCGSSTWRTRAGSARRRSASSARPSARPRPSASHATGTSQLPPPLPVASTSAQFSLVLRVRIAHRPGMLGRVATAIGEAGGTIGSVDLISLDDDTLLRDIIVDAADGEHARAIADAVDAVEGAQVVDRTDRTFLMHLGGKIEQRNKQALRTRDDLSMAYAPGVARVCSAIAQDRDKAFQYTIKRNTVAVVSDGSAVLGLGDIGTEAAVHVM